MDRQPVKVNRVVYTKNSFIQYPLSKDDKLPNPFQPIIDLYVNTLHPTNDPWKESKKIDNSLFQPTNNKQLKISLTLPTNIQIVMGR